MDYCIGGRLLLDVAVAELALVLCFEELRIMLCILSCLQPVLAHGSSMTHMRNFVQLRPIGCLQSPEFRICQNPFPEHKLFYKENPMLKWATEKFVRNWCQLNVHGYSNILQKACCRNEIDIGIGRKWCLRSCHVAEQSNVLKSTQIEKKSIKGRTKKIFEHLNKGISCNRRIFNVIYLLKDYKSKFETITEKGVCCYIIRTVLKRA